MVDSGGSSADRSCDGQSHVASHLRQAASCRPRAISDLPARSHLIPELLDWLAAEFVEPTQSESAPWSMKTMIRLLVMSDAFRRSSQPMDAGMRKPTLARLCCGATPPQRVEAGGDPRRHSPGIGQTGPDHRRAQLSHSQRKEDLCPMAGGRQSRQGDVAPDALPGAHAPGRRQDVYRLRFPRLWSGQGQAPRFRRRRCRR